MVSLSITSKNKDIHVVLVVSGGPRVQSIFLLFCQLFWIFCLVFFEYWSPSNQSLDKKNEKSTGQLGGQETDQTHMNAPNVVEKMVDVWYLWEEFARFKK